MAHSVIHEIHANMCILAASAAVLWGTGSRTAQGNIPSTGESERPREGVFTGVTHAALIAVGVEPGRFVSLLTTKGITPTQIIRAGSPVMMTMDTVRGARKGVLPVHRLG